MAPAKDKGDHSNEACAMTVTRDANRGLPANRTLVMNAAERRRCCSSVEVRCPCIRHTPPAQLPWQLHALPSTNQLTNVPYFGNERTVLTHMVCFYPGRSVDACARSALAGADRSAVARKTYRRSAERADEFYPRVRQGRSAWWDSTRPRVGSTGRSCWVSM